ncbi:non-specific lipid transfer protein GPI-anchored 25 [Fagus crenata]
MISSITLSLIVLNYLLIFMLFTAPLPPPPPPSSCSDELVLVSPCMPYVSSSPNNLSENCCNTISSSALNSTNGVCLCHLAHQPSKSPTKSFLNYIETVSALACLRNTTISGQNNHYDRAPKFNDDESPPDPEKTLPTLQTGLSFVSHEAT